VAAEENVAACAAAGMNMMEHPIAAAPIGRIGDEVGRCTVLPLCWTL
jgi:hypothetical protein